MVQLDGALIKEQGVTFAVVVVKRHVVANQFEARKAMASFSRYFPGVPIVLMAQDHRGVPTYFGRPDLSKFLANTSMARIPWQKFTFN